MVSCAHDSDKGVVSARFFSGWRQIKPKREVGEASTMENSTLCLGNRDDDSENLALSFPPARELLLTRITPEHQSNLRLSRILTPNFTTHNVRPASYLAEIFLPNLTTMGNVRRHRNLYGGERLVGRCQSVAVKAEGRQWW